MEQIREDVVEKTKIFINEIAKIPVDRLVFQDESGFQETLRRANAWSKTGSPAVCYHSAQPAQNISVIGAIRLSGPVTMKSYEGGTTKKRFFSWFRSCLLPNLKAEDCVVLDNLRAHHSVEVKALAKRSKIRLLYTPPYSPQYNPIEIIWAIMKRRLRSFFLRFQDRFRYSIAAAWRAVKDVNFESLFVACLPGGSTQAI